MADIIDVNIGDQVLEVFWQDEVELNLDMDLMYIKSGQKEIQDYVDNVSKPEINSYIETEAEPIVTEVVNTIAEPIVNEYLETVTKPAIDEYFNKKKPEIEDLVSQAENYASNSQTSAQASASSALAAENALTTLTTTATDNFNANAESKTNAFNTNAADKQAQVDASANAAKESETNAAESAVLAANSAGTAAASEANAKIWADGTDSEVIALGGVHSSKVWAETAQTVVDGKQDIANLSQTLDDSTTKYPSNNAVKTALGGKANVALDNVSPAQSFKDLSIGWGMPDYSAGVSKSWNTLYTADRSGYVYFYAYSRLAAIYIAINGVNIYSVNEPREFGYGHGLLVPIAKGDTYKASGGASGQSIVFYPCKE